MEGNMIGQFQWINGYKDKHSNPVYKHAKNPDKWEVKDSRFIMYRYGEGGAIDIKIMENGTDFKHTINITVDDDGKLKAIVSEQTK
jgi:hypothetical protein